MIYHYQGLGIAHSYPKVLAVKLRIVRKWKHLKREWTKVFNDKLLHRTTVKLYCQKNT